MPTGSPTLPASAAVNRPSSRPSSSASNAKPGKSPNANSKSGQKAAGGSGNKTAAAEEAPKKKKTVMTISKLLQAQKDEEKEEEEDPGFGLGTQEEDDDPQGFADFASVVKGLNLNKLRRAGNTKSQISQKERVKLCNPGSLTETEGLPSSRTPSCQKYYTKFENPSLPFSPCRHPCSHPEQKNLSLPFSPCRHPEWSPRAVAQDAIQYTNYGDMSPIRRMAVSTLEGNKALPVKAVVHHIDVDPLKVKQSTEETTLHNVTTVSRRTQRALTAEEVAENTEKSIAFFKNARATNQTVAFEAKRGGGWSKLRKKFLRL